VDYRRLTTRRAFGDGDTSSYAMAEAWFGIQEEADMTTIIERESSRFHYDEANFGRLFNHRPFMVEHDLVGHPLFKLSRLVELARALPENRVEYNSGDVPITLDPAMTPRTGLSIEETIVRIEECRSWMVLKNVEGESPYRQLLMECLAPVRRRLPDMRTEEAFIFISSAGSVTPFHIDPECNFLLQVRGVKSLRLFPNDDRNIVLETEIENFYSGANRNLRCRDEAGLHAEIFELTPGQGLHIPVTAPHWVRNGPEVSISFSITFRTADSDRREILYRVNQRLRRIGLRPTPVGRSKRSDDLKFGIFNAARRVAKLVRRSSAP